MECPPPFFFFFSSSVKRVSSPRNPHAERMPCRTFWLPLRWMIASSVWKVVGTPVFFFFLLAQIKLSAAALRSTQCTRRRAVRLWTGGPSVDMSISVCTRLRARLPLPVPHIGLASSNIPWPKCGHSTKLHAVTYLPRWNKHAIVCLITRGKPVAIAMTYGIFWPLMDTDLISNWSQALSFSRFNKLCSFRTK